MPDSAPAGIRKRWFPAIALLASCCGAALLQYWPALSFGFVYDDYHFVRPYDAADLLRVFHGSWDGAGIEPPFYRPLTVLLYAARFEAFGVNETAYHVLSVLGFALCGWLAALLVWRITGKVGAALWIALFWTVHPNAPLSLVAWITNQMHLAQTLVIVLSLLWWWRIKAAAWLSWTPLLLAGVIAFLIKEDGIMLLPAIVIAHELFHWICDRRVPHVPIAFAAPAAIMLPALFVLRRAMLGGLGGYGSAVTRDTILTNVIKGPAQTLFLLPVGSAGTLIQAWGMTLALVAGVVFAWRGGERRHLFVIALGVLVVGLFDLPFALVTKREQYYALTLGAVLAFGACSDAITLALRPRLRAVAVGLLAIVLAAMSQRAAAARDLYAPFSESTLATDRLVQGWAPVPIEIRQWLIRKITTGQVTSLSHDLAYVVFGASDLEHDRRGQPFRWTGSHVRIYENANVRYVTFLLRAAGSERPPRPFVVEVSQRHRTISNLHLEPGQQQEVDVTVQRGGLLSLLSLLPRTMPYVEIDVDHTWTPGPGDPRQLGVILADIAVFGR
jgi:hypothetical protein